MRDSPTFLGLRFFVVYENVYLLVTSSTFDFSQERRVKEDRLKMQKDFEEEQEKNRKKEEEVMGIFSYLK